MPVLAQNTLCTQRLRPIMHKKMTITLDERVYDGLYRTVGKRRMSQFIEDLLRPHVLDNTLDAGYREMAADSEREAEATACGAAHWQATRLMTRGLSCWQIKPRQKCIWINNRDSLVLVHHQQIRIARNDDRSIRR